MIKSKKKKMRAVIIENVTSLFAFLLTNKRMRNKKNKHTSSLKTALEKSEILPLYKN